MDRLFPPGPGAVTAHLAGFRQTFDGYIVPTTAVRTQPRITGDHVALLSSLSGDRLHKLKSIIYNQVKKCASCEKPCAVSLSVCNSCGVTLSDVPVTLTPNVFTGFILGLERTTFPLTISIRHQSPDTLIFDDPLALSSVHLNAVPTHTYIPDWRFLLLDPLRGITLLRDLTTAAWDVMHSTFLSNAAFVRSHFAPAVADEVLADAAAAKPYVLDGLNLPPSQFQLHIQCMLLPLLPQHAALLERAQHFTVERFFPTEYIVALLEAVAKAQSTVPREVDGVRGTWGRPASW